MGFWADLHVHSKYSRATSQNMDPAGIAKIAKLKGIKLMGTGDFTHPLYLKELKQLLEPTGTGLFVYNDVYFMLTTEVSNIYEKHGHTYKIHNIILAPDFQHVEAINRYLSKYGALESDGRPILGLDPETMVRELKKISPQIEIIPAHIWTPWFSLFGANSGVNRIEDAFGDMTEHILALETGLSSDPWMNWHWSALDRWALVSNSDAHSPLNIGREANYFETKLDYFDIIDAIRTQDRKRFGYTIEFFPEEGKYHYDGHRKCGVRLHPREAMFNNNICPVCGKPLTIGVLHRVYMLGDRTDDELPKDRIPFYHVIPLREIIADVVHMGKDSHTVENRYMRLVCELGTEMEILLNLNIDDIKAIDPEVGTAIDKMRRGEVKVEPGYDGVYGVIKIEAEPPESPQLSLF
ncbi:DNA helicase UvrD [candidate division WOR-3 bacterium]|nr:DNA helicase UvrD [candidate division WOR-3 bacterium]